MVKYVTILKKVLMFIFEREKKRERAVVGTERETENPKQVKALNCQHGGPARGLQLTNCKIMI